MKTLILFVIGLLVLGCGKKGTPRQQEKVPASLNAGNNEKPKGESQRLLASLAQFLKGKQVDIKFTDPDGGDQKTLQFVFKKDGHSLSFREPDQLSYDHGTYEVRGKLIFLTNNDLNSEKPVLKLKTETLAIGDVVDLLDSLDDDNGIEGEIAKIEPKSIYTITDLKDFKEFLKVPLNDEETKYEGRWECKDLGFWLIQRKDRTYTMLEVLQAGDEIEGKFVRRLEHGIWGIKDRKLLYRELLIRDGELIPPVFWRMFPEEITSFGVDKITFSEREISYQKGLEGEIIKGKYVPPPQIRVQQFQEPEMKSYNDKAALEGFDIIKAMEKAKR